MKTKTSPPSAVGKRLTASLSRTGKHPSPPPSPAGKRLTASLIIRTSTSTNNRQHITKVEAHTNTLQKENKTHIHNDNNILQPQEAVSTEHTLQKTELQIQSHVPGGGTECGGGERRSGGDEGSACSMQQQPSEAITQIAHARRSLITAKSSWNSCCPL